MSEWWIGFLWGAVAVAQIEVVAFVAILAVTRRRDRQLKRILEERIFTRLRSDDREI